VSLSPAAPAAVEHDQLQARTDYEALLGENKRLIRWERGWVSRRSKPPSTARMGPVCRLVTLSVDLQDRRWPERTHDVGIDVSLTN
jgi:hypothetical protein